MLLALLLAYWFKPGRTEGRGKTAPMALGRPFAMLTGKRGEAEGRSAASGLGRGEIASTTMGRSENETAGPAVLLSLPSSERATRADSHLPSQRRSSISHRLLLVFQNNWKRGVLFLSSIPIAIMVNALRIAITGMLYPLMGAAAAEGFFHDFSGWLIFMFTIPILLLEMWVLRRIPA
jgi:exosortase/archaeosortase family protein